MEIEWKKIANMKFLFHSIPYYDLLTIGDKSEV